MPRTFETAALLKSGVGGSATHGTGDASLDQVGANQGAGLPGAQGSGTVNSDGTSYKGEPTEGDAGDEANTFGPGKAVKKYSPPPKKIDEGYSAHLVDVLTTPMFDKFYDELSALQEAVTAATPDAALGIRKEIQTAAETSEPTGIT